MKLVILVLSLLFLSGVNAQIPNRYVDEVFENVIETKDVIFSTSVPQPTVNIFNFYVLITGIPVSVREYDTENVTLRMDIFEPEGDEAIKRPLVIICFGGGFVQGSRDYWSMRLLAEGLARRGFVTASIDYRLGMDLFDQDIGARSVYRGIQDSRSAIRFFRANAETYNIDPDKIFIGGHSSGAFIAMHNIYLDDNDERPPGTFAGFQGSNAIPDLGCLDCVGDNLGFNGKATAAFNLAGALGDLNFVESGSEPPLLQFHSSDDGTVPYNSGEPFSDISGLIIGSDLPIVFGSAPTAQRFTDLGIDNKFNSYNNRGHGVHENGSVALHSDILPTIGDWFFEQFLKPNPAPITGIDALCVADKEQTYALASNDFNYFDWQITGGSFTSMSNDADAVDVTWDEFAEVHQLSVKAYDSNGAEAETVVFDVDLVSQASNSWNGLSSGLWDVNTNWSLGRVPLTCEDVLISEGDQAIEIQLDPLKDYKVRSLEIEDNVVLRIPSTTTFSIEKQ